MNTITLNIEGMTCGHCEEAVNKALQGVQGVGRVQVSRAQGQARLDVAPDVHPETLVTAVREEGYEAAVA
jgi:copper chaperone